MRLAVLAVLVLACGPVFSQNETVTVTGATPPSEKLDVTIDRFVDSYIRPSTNIVGKIARWTDRVCAMSSGLKDEQNKFVADRIMQIAARVGAPVETKLPCRANVEVLFALNPQELMDEIRIRHGHLLGYNDGPMQARQMAAMKHPVQAYYSTQTRDFWGNIIPDDNRECPVCTYITSGSRISDGIKSEFTNVLVVVDINKAKSHELGALADYVAVYALAQTKAFGACRALPSITNLMVADCAAENRATTLTAADIGLLQGVYKMDPSTKGNLARGDISGQMEKTLSGK